MSTANPRSPESGDVPEEGTAVTLRGREYVYTNRGYGERSWYLRYDDHSGLFVERTSELSHALSALASLTAELSTARERADRAEQAVKRAVEIADDHCARGKEVTIHHASEPIGVRGGCTITKVGDLVDVRDDLERHVRATVDPDWHFNVTRYRDRAKSDA